MRQRSASPALALLLLPLLALGNPVGTGHATARLLAEHDPAVPGAPLDLLLSLAIRPGWHTYWRNPGDSGEAPRVDWTLPPGVTAGALEFPAPALIRVGPLANYGYSGRALHPVKLRIPADWSVGTPVQVRAQAHWLVCAEHCVPESATLDLTLGTAAQAGPPDPAVRDDFARARAGLPNGVLAGALLGESAGGLRLSLPLLGLGQGPAGVRFFPWSWGLIEPAADQPWRVAGDRLEIDLTPGEAASSADPGGLLTVRGSDGTERAYDLTPARDLPAQAPMPAGAADLGLPLALGFAFLGGLILNLMPCVFPVLAIKALSLAGQGGLGARGRGLHGLAYTAGVLVFFAGLAAILLALRAGGGAVGWGFQLQSPPFVALMAYVFLALGLALAGAWTLGSGLMGLAGGRVGGGTVGAFGTGALAALVAAPCTAPLMGAALGYALTLDWPRALAILLTLGLGLAAPFLLLSLAPGLARLLPRPGVWMEHLKQLLAFPMLATAAWLVWVLSVQSGPSGVASVLAGMLVLTLGLWVRERTAMASAGWRRLGAGAALAGLAVAVWLGLATATLAPTSLGQPGGAQVSRSGHGPEPWSPERLAQARAQGRPVFVNMTAAWCITCLVNERVALGKRTVADAFAAANVLYLKGDWTNRDARIGDYLAGFGRSGVPIYVYYPPGSAPRVLPQILTPSIVRQALGSRPEDPE
jgi:thiol:disulfide interchange protein